MVKALVILLIEGKQGLEWKHKNKSVKWEAFFDSLIGFKRADLRQLFVLDFCGSSNCRRMVEREVERLGWYCFVIPFYVTKVFAESVALSSSRFGDVKRFSISVSYAIDDIGRGKDERISDQNERLGTWYSSTLWIKEIVLRRAREYLKAHGWTFFWSALRGAKLAKPESSLDKHRSIRNWE